MNIVIYLLQHSAIADVPTVRGETPLHLAARANQTDIIRILLRNGAQVDARARVSVSMFYVTDQILYAVASEVIDRHPHTVTRMTGVWCPIEGAAIQVYAVKQM